MADPSADPIPEPAAQVEPVAVLGPPGRAPRAGRGAATLAIVAAIAVAIVAAIWLVGRSTGPSNPPSAANLPIRIALYDPRTGLAVEDVAGHRTVLAAPPDTSFGFPAWSPDGSRVAVVSNGSAGPSISVFAVPAADTLGSPAPTPVVVYHNADSPPFYVYWTPDGRRVSFLATERDGISLRVAPADASAPLDGSGPGATIRRGAPLYFDWIDDAHLLVHVGSGASGFAGEVGADGSPSGATLTSPGDFRSAVISADHATIAWVRGAVPAAAIVVAARDGSAEHTVPVFGPAAVVFDPTSSRVATIAAADAAAPPFPFPLGPLRLVDPATGAVRTLLDGRVVGFFWAPDGRTIAALRVEDADGATEARLPITLAAASSPAPSPAASPTAEVEIHLLFVDVETGRVRSDRTVRPTSNFLNQFLPYFDQYALSHRLWARDSSAYLIPLVDGTGEGGLAVLTPDGGTATRTIPGVNGFWSP
jgi:TolB protein